MEHKGPCSSDELLQHLLLGLVPHEQAARLEEHVLGCSQCGERLAGIQAEDALVAAARAQATLAAVEGDTRVQRLIDRLCHLPMPATRPSSGPLPDAEGIDELRRFFGPAETPGELGRVGTYRVLKYLGSGGMGMVLEAEDTQLGRRVALKVMRPMLAAVASAKARFLREARAAAAIQHDNVITIHQVGEHEGLPYLAMPLLRGESLRQRLARQGVLAPAETIRIGREIALGLAAAHGREVIHRDIKPDNIWLEAGSDGANRVKILDFGLAHRADDLARLTHSGAVTGTPAYMAPEQIDGAAIDARADLFSLGCVLYETCTGRPAFSRLTVAATLMAVAEETPDSPRELNPDMPQPLSDLVIKLLEKNAADRYPDAATVAARLADLPEHRPFPHKASRSARGRFLSGIVATAFTAIVVAAIIWIKTTTGTLVLQVDPPDVRVTIDGENINLRSPRDEIDVHVGSHDLKVSKDGFKTFTKAFEVAHGGRVEVSAKLELSTGPAPAAPAAPADSARGLSDHAKPTPENASAPTEPIVISFSGSEAMIDWLRHNAAQGSDSALVRDVGTLVEKQQQEKRAFQFQIGWGLMKSHEMTILAAHDGHYFARRCPEYRDFPKMVAASIASVPDVERTSTDAKLVELTIEGAGDLDPAKEVRGTLKLQSLCDKQAKYGVRLTCGPIISVDPTPWTPAQGHGVERIEFSQLAQDALNRDGPLLVFAELCLFPEPEDKHYVIVSDPLPALVNVRSRTGK